MKKIFANIFIVAFIVMSVQQSMAQQTQQVVKTSAKKPTAKQCVVVVDKKAKPEHKTAKQEIHKVAAKAIDAKTKPDTKAVAQVPKAAPAKEVSEKIKEEEKRVAAAKQAHELKKTQPESKVLAPTAKSEDETVAEDKPEKKYDSTLCFPLKQDNIYSLYTFVIDLRDKNIISKYKPFFDRNNYEFTGYVWQGLLKQMINSAGDKIVHNVFIKAEDNLVCFTITSFDVKTELPEYICPILSSPKLFASYVRKANRQDINNY